MCCVVTVCAVAACSREPESPPAVTTAPAATSIPETVPVDSVEPACLVRTGAIGPLQVGMALDEARRAMRRATFTRTSDGDGVALVDVALDGTSLAIAYAGEEDAEKPVDMTRPIEQIETFAAACETTDGIHPGSTVEEAAAVYGPVRIIQRSEIESREYVEFERQPPGLQFRLDSAGEFADGASETTRHAPGAKLLSISVSPP